MFSPGVQAAVRALAGYDAAFVQLDGIDAMRTYYDRLFNWAVVESVEVLNAVHRPWYTFAELRWTFTLRAGGRTRVTTAEVMPFDQRGYYAARIGFAGEPTPC